MSNGVYPLKTQCPSSQDERNHMDKIPYEFVVGSIIYMMLCICPDVLYALSMMSK